MGYPDVPPPYARTVHYPRNKFRRKYVGDWEKIDPPTRTICGQPLTQAKIGTEDEVTCGTCWKFVSEYVLARLNPAEAQRQFRERQREANRRAVIRSKAYVDALRILRDRHIDEFRELCKELRDRYAAKAS